MMKEAPCQLRPRLDFIGLSTRAGVLKMLEGKENENAGPGGSVFGAVHGGRDWNEGQQLDDQGAFDVL